MGIKVKKSKTKKKAKKAVKKYVHHPDHYNKSEAFLIQDLDLDLKDAWFKLREFGASLGEQKIYASGRAIMFSKKVCYFFVRPKKTYLEVVLFLRNEKEDSGFKSIRAVSKTKFAHTFRLIHGDQVEGELVQAIGEAFAETPT
ncbi:MAG: DUF5655 domain-containing protein [Bdellovibrionales bacterium]